MFILEDCDNFFKVAAVIFQMSETRGTKCSSYLLQCPVKRVLFPCDAKITVVRRHVKEMSELSKGKTT